MSNVAQLIPAVNPLTELQKALALLTLGGDIRVCDRHEIADLQAGNGRDGLSMYQLTNGKLLMARHLETLPVASKPRTVIADWLTSPSTKVYSTLAFSPLLVSPDTLNFWIAPPVLPVAGTWTVIHDFLRDIICGGDELVFAYLIRYLAHMVQHPEEKPGIMPVMLGGQGIGKGTFYELLCAIWPCTTLHVSNVDHVIGQFNAVLERNFAIFMDEAVFQGDKRAIDRLKSFITEPSVTIEQKHQPRRNIKSYHRFFAGSNHLHFANVDCDDRRFLFLQVSEARHDDVGYWNELHQALKDQAMIGAMMHHLIELDLTSFNVRKRPKTAAHLDQKLRSLSGFDRFWFEILQAGEIPGAYHSALTSTWAGPIFIGTRALLEAWNECEKGQRQFATRQSHVLTQTLGQICPSAVPAREKHLGQQLRGFLLPSLPEARADFCRKMGGDVSWEE